MQMKTLTVPMHAIAEDERELLKTMCRLLMAGARGFDFDCPREDEQPAN